MAASWFLPRCVLTWEASRRSSGAESFVASGFSRRDAPAVDEGRGLQPPPIFPPTQSPLVRKIRHQRVQFLARRIPPRRRPGDLASDRFQLVLLIVQLPRVTLEQLLLLRAAAQRLHV